MEDMVADTLSTRVDRLMKARGLTSAEAARQCGGHESWYSTLRRGIKGHERTNAKRLAALARVLGTTVEYLETGRDAPQVDDPLMSESDPRLDLCESVIEMAQPDERAANALRKIRRLRSDEGVDMGWWLDRLREREEIVRRIDEARGELDARAARVLDTPPEASTNLPAAKPKAKSLPKKAEKK